MTTGLGFQSEYVINHLSCEVIEHDEFTVLRTPDNPNYYFGNMLALKVPLHSKSRSEWQQAFQQAFADMPKVKHETYSWPRCEQFNANSLEDFAKDHFAYEEDHILTQPRSTFTKPLTLNTEVSLRPLTSDTDWQQWMQLSIQEMNTEHDESSLRPYLLAKRDKYRKLEARGYGQYMGAFAGERLIGYAGLYHLHKIARFQSVHVIPEFENRKVAKTLLTRLIEQVNPHVETLVIVADEHYHATLLYQSLGFQVTERQCSLSWWPERNQQA
ncbi:GNAT family N-acetyltransferase [Reinekea marinisedimentorum]|uniref:Acetyltransferase (GNAT) family protein n=1 Tax=Reinekea marinisedimentorum TaxID=230495 RepID=A0A4R3HZD2_9GAMM|nr:GNAT family N-acetyltransferase [Reinekea marinisedimentorum]TCS38736.1 acetyltransferase (GNAT) family protein [Reinekea marinisedimentorum]